MRRNRGAQREAGRLLVPGLVFLGMVVAVVSSLGASLIPTIAETYDVSPNVAQWSLTITFLVSAPATPLLGRLGDGPHRRQVIIGILAAVTLGSVLAALPLGFPLLLVGRGLQGIGLALTPLGIAVVRDALPPERVPPAAAKLSVTTAAGIGLGYPITGLVALHGGLHAAFWFGAAVSAAGLLIAVLVVPSAANRPRTPIDFPGVVLLGAALSGLLLALSEGGRWGWTSPAVILVVAASLVTLAGWVLLESRRRHPLVDLRLLTRRGVLTADVIVLLAGVGMYVLISLTTRFVQTPSSTGYGLGATVVVAGLTLLPFSAASALATRLTRSVATTVSSSVVLATGAVLVLAASVLFACATTGMGEVLTVMALAGLGVGAIFAVLPGLIVGSVPAHETGSATSFHQVIRYVGYAVGSAMSGAVLEAATGPGQPFPVAAGYTHAALLGGGVSVLTVVASIVLPRLRAGTAPSAQSRAGGNTEPAPHVPCG
ncbi:MFS transporter [Nonomuraea jiangxiensis]|uniref:Major Facilitator Superfamily protein n=1 Tax=Nonomuraea jiangxiensis TaxID=633440 RepID=A0A1G9J4U8_9ACTN|nr:MFS transporter [Nonomuraea jiangxiensis]SDL32243.1 Major Facilitator Superfamily protein [Nonomuraea jiangxiensis]